MKEFRVYFKLAGKLKVIEVGSVVDHAEAVATVLNWCKETKQAPDGAILTVVK